MGGANTPLHFLHPGRQPPSQFLRPVIPLPNSVPTTGYTVQASHPYPCSWLDKWTLRQLHRPCHFRFEGTGRRKPHFFSFGLRTCSPIQLLSKEAFIWGPYGACQSLSKLVLCPPFDYYSSYITWPRTHGAASLSWRTYSRPESLHLNT